MLQPPLRGADIAVVLIHGIGDIAPGRVLESTVEALRRRLEVVVAEPRPLPPGGFEQQGGNHARVSRRELAWQGRGISIFEFNWTQVPGKLRLRRPLDALRKFAGVLQEFPRLGATVAHPRQQRIAVWAGHFQRALLLAMLIAVFGAVCEVGLRPGLAKRVLAAAQQGHGEADALGTQEALKPLFGIEAPPGSETLDSLLLNGVTSLLFSPTALIEERAFCTLSAVALYLISGLYYALVAVGYVYFLPVRLLLWRKLTAAATLWRTLVVSSVLCLMVSMAALQLPFFALAGAAFLRDLASFGQAGGWNSSYWIAIAAAEAYVLLRASVVLANLMRDVVHYLAADDAGLPAPHQLQISDELDRLLTSLEAGGTRRVILVAHSLGTVIVTDLLAKRASRRGPASTMRLDLVTAGSPLRRFVARLLPERKSPMQLRASFAHGSPGGVERWFNYHRLFDYVGQALNYSSLPLDLLGWKRRRDSAESAIRDQLLTPRLRWPLAHSNYWSDARFLRALAEEVVLPALALEPARRTRA